VAHGLGWRFIFGQYRAGGLPKHRLGLFLQQHLAVFNKNAVDSRAKKKRFWGNGKRPTRNIMAKNRRHKN
jgi:hypothetical protein